MIKVWFAQLRTGSGIFELMRFVFIGGLATLVDLTVTLVLFFFFPRIHENLVTTCAFGIAFFVSYFGHRYVTFKQHGSVVRFFLLSASMLLLRNILVFLMVTFWMRGLMPIIVAMVLVTAITYLVSKYQIFADK